MGWYEAFMTSCSAEELILAGADNVMRINHRSASRETLDYYPTPPWATQALLDFIHPAEWDKYKARQHMSCLEPAAGGGHMYDVLAQHFKRIGGFDIADPEGRGWGGHDFLEYQPPTKQLGELVPIHHLGYQRQRYDWAITNPPFIHALSFVHRMLATAQNVAVLARLQWLEGKGRYERLWNVMPPQKVLVFSERVQMAQGRLAEPSDSGSVMAMAWYIWQRTETSNFKLAYDKTTELCWLPPRNNGEQQGLEI